jgi:hypothetical protein
VKPKAYDALCQVYPAFEQEHARRVAEGRVRQSLASVAFVGLARNCDGALYANLHRVVAEGQRFASWQLHIETNDNTDRTEEVLEAFASEFPEASYRTQTLDRQQFAAEFAGPRTVALAEYRTACQEWVREHAPSVDYVAVVDFDAWGGWIPDAIASGLGWLVRLPGAYGMASVSLMQVDAGQQGRHWVHYDAWALRLNSYWDDYTAGHGAWKHHWIPAIGSPPVHVCSAFGGLGIYRREAFLKGRYDGADCEHVTFHKSVADATGQHLFLNPGQRMLMHWLLEASTDGGGNNGDDQR